ncbi:MAG: class I SAM-dependent methyltransferase [Tuberibacillus sp.]
MDDHYYSPTPQSTSNPKEILFNVNGKDIKLKTDRGVFSKESVDFGSRLLIETFELPSVDGPVLDVGCGYGVIGISINKKYPNSQITMIDINERAVFLASENAMTNKVNAQVFQSNLYEKVTGRFAAIVSNPPIRAGKEVVHKILTEAQEYLLPQGEIWIVIQKKQGAPSALKKMEETYGEAEVIKKSKGYYIIRAKKSE